VHEYVIVAVSSLLAIAWVLVLTALKSQSVPLVLSAAGVTAVRPDVAGVAAITAPAATGKKLLVAATSFTSLTAASFDAIALKPDQLVLIADGRRKMLSLAIVRTVELPVPPEKVFQTMVIVWSAKPPNGSAVFTPKHPPNANDRPLLLKFTRNVGLLPAMPVYPSTDVPLLVHATLDTWLLSWPDVVGNQYCVPPSNRFSGHVNSLPSVGARTNTVPAP
jgi:hypothetical protein